MRHLVATFVLMMAWTIPTEAGQPVAVYRGSWHSESTGHQGRMRMRLLSNPDGSFNARFWGRFALVIPFTYRVKMNTVNTSQGRRLVASKRLPVFGKFQTVAEVSRFGAIAQYWAERDRGHFRMSRVR